MKIPNQHRPHAWIVGLLACALTGCGSEPVDAPAPATAAEAAAKSGPTNPEPTALAAARQSSQQTGVQSDVNQPTKPEASTVGSAEKADSSTPPKATKPVPQMSVEAFLLAAHDGRLDLVRRGIDSGIDLGATDAQLHNALHMAAYNGHSEIVKLLLEHDVEIDPRDAEGKTPLLHACTGPFAETVEILIEAGADVNAPESTESFTPLMMAAGLGQTEVVKVLLRNKADASRKDDDGDMAIDHARNSGHAEIVELLKTES